MEAPNKSELERRLSPFGQEHLLAEWEALDAAAQRQFADQILALDLPLLRKLHAGGAEAAHEGELLPPAVVGLPESFEDWERQQKAGAAGEALLAAGKVAIVMVAGGQGSRLGHEAPKGTFAIGPVSGHCLFQLHAEQVLALSRRHERPVPLLIMTSQENDGPTRDFFVAHRHFGLDPAQVTFFPQGMLPALDAATGRILLTGPGQIALSPNGHGGTLDALHRGGHLRRLRDQGIETLYYFQVDNPLAKIADPFFLGLHHEHGAELSVKVVRKTDPDERIGLVVQRDGKLAVVEYSELKPGMAAARTADGGLRFWAGNTAIHLFQVNFLLRLAEGETMLPYHKAHKAVAHWQGGAPIKAEAPNAHKFEMFIFDALPLAKAALVVETDRAEEFEPLKNATGPYSPSTVRQAIADRAAAWLSLAGVETPRDAAGHAVHPLEISPLFALDAEELRDKVAGLGAIDGPLFLDAAFRPPPEAETEPDDEAEEG